MNENISMFTIMEDLYQISILLNNSVDKDHKRFIKSKINGLESNLYYYFNKYKISKKPIKKKVIAFQYDYKKGVQYINHFLIHKIVQDYLKDIKPYLLDMPLYMQKRIEQDLLSYIHYGKNYTSIVPSSKARKNHHFKTFCDLDKISKSLEKSVDIDAFSNRFKQLALYSDKITFLLENTKNQFIKTLYQVGFLNELIYDEEQRENIVLTKENIYISLIETSNNFTDTLALFIFWLNKYIKCITGYQNYLFSSIIQRKLLKSDKYEETNMDLYCKLFNTTKLEYQKQKEAFISTKRFIEKLYKLKNYCLSVLLRVSSQNMIYIYKDYEKFVLNYKNPTTQIITSFHINDEKMNQFLLRKFPMKSEKLPKQSIPKHQQVKKYQKSMFDV